MIQANDICLLQGSEEKKLNSFAVHSLRTLFNCKSRLSSIMVVQVAEKSVVTDSYLPSVLWRFISILSSEAPYAHVFFSTVGTVTCSAYEFMGTRSAYKAKKVVVLKANFFLTYNTRL